MWTNFDGQSSDAPLVTYEYDEFGNTADVTSYKDELTGRETIYTYDELNRVVETDHPGSLGTEKFQYNAGGLRAKMDGSGAVTVYEYDTLNRVTKVQYNYTGDWPVPDEYTISTPDVAYTYRYDTGLVKTMVDSTGATSYDYDHRGRLIGYTPAVPSNYGSITYQYDNAGNKTQMTTPQGTTNYTYYRNGWLKQLSANSSAVVVNYAYDANGNRTSETRNNNTITAWTYDARDRISAINHGTGIADVAYTRDGIGSPLTASWVNGSTSWNVAYTYDINNRLASENHSLQGQRSWTYDWVGNRLDTGFVYDAQTDELTEGPSGITRQYTTAGSMYEKDTTTYTYNAQELMTDAGSVSFDWDAEARRVRLTSGSDVYQFVYDPTAGIPAVLFEDRPGNDVQYIREPGGALVARIAGESVKFYHFDALGSTVAITNGSGTVTDRDDYGAWGEIYPLLAGTSDNPYLYVGQLGYYAHWMDANLADALQLGVRFYEAGIGRFTQRGSPYTYQPMSRLGGWWQRLKDWWHNRGSEGDDKGADLAKSQLRSMLRMMLDAANGKNCFPIGKLLGELEKLKKMTPSERQKVIDACKDFTDEACKKNDNCLDRDNTLYAYCTQCCQALFDFLGQGGLGGQACKGEPFCGPLLGG